MPSVSHPIVGAHFHPPAKAILEFLPISHPLILLPEPTNEVDPNAIAIWLDSSSLPEVGGDAWESALAGFGLTWPELKAQPFWHLGYIPAAVAAELGLQHRVEAEFTVGAKGGPRIRFDLESISYPNASPGSSTENLSYFD